MKGNFTKSMNFNFLISQFFSVKFDFIDVNTFNEILCFQIYNSSAKLALFMNKEYYGAISGTCHVKGIILKEKFTDTTMLLGFRLQKNNFLYHLFAENMEGLVSSGIAQKIQQKYFKNPPLDDQKAPNSLSTDALAFCFKIWLMTTFASVFVFLIEIFYFYIITLFYLIKEFIGVFIFFKSINSLQRILIK